jgi:hypothetical protein
MAPRPRAGLTPGTPVAPTETAPAVRFASSSSQNPRRRRGSGRREETHRGKSIRKRALAASRLPLVCPGATASWPRRAFLPQPATRCRQTKPTSRDSAPQSAARCTFLGGVQQPLRQRRATLALHRGQSPRCPEMHVTAPREGLKTSAYPLFSVDVAKTQQYPASRAVWTLSTVIARPVH